MKFREVKYLTNSLEFKDFVHKYKLKWKILDNERIFLSSHCLFFEIYALVVEDIYYFDIYSLDLNFTTTLNILLTDFDSSKLRLVYDNEVETRNLVLIPQLQISQHQSNLEFTLRAEVYFFTMLKLMDEFLSDVLSCQREIKQEYWSEIFEFKKNELKETPALSDLESESKL